MPGQDFSNAMVKEFIADAAITQNAAVVAVIATEDHCNLPAAANSVLFLGFAIDACASGERVRVHVGGGIAKAVCGATVALGDYLMINGTTGSVKPLVLGASNQHVVAKALRGGASGDVIPVKFCEFVAQGA